jgi:hypothetical protein
VTHAVVAVTEMAAREPVAVDEPADVLERQRAGAAAVDLVDLVDGVTEEAFRLTQPVGCSARVS